MGFRLCNGGARAAAGAGLLLVLVAFAATAEGAAPRAADSTRILASLESAPLGVVAVLGPPRALEAQGWAAPATVEQVLDGEAPADLEIVWEELVPDREARFAEGDRVLIALEPLPGQSLWRRRLPDLASWSRIRRVAERDAAFVRRPSSEALSLIFHYLGLPPEARRGADGRRHLLALAAEVEEPVALSAARQLGAGPPLAPATASLAVRALSRPEPAVTAELLAWVERARPEGLLPALDLALAGEGPAPPALFSARGLLDGSLPEARVSWLLAQEDPAYREAAMRFASDPDVLAERLRRDESAAVRGAAALRLGSLQGPAALGPLLDALGDEDVSVRHRAAGVLASFGPPAVPALEEVVLSRASPARETAVLSLRRMGSPEALAALTTLADEHPDPAMRAVVGVAIGRPLGKPD